MSYFKTKDWRIRYIVYEFGSWDWLSLMPMATEQLHSPSWVACCSNKELCMATVTWGAVKMLRFFLQLCCYSSFSYNVSKIWWYSDARVINGFDAKRWFHKILLNDRFISFFYRNYLNYLLSERHLIVRLQNLELLKYNKWSIYYIACKLFKSMIFYK